MIIEIWDHMLLHGLFHVGQGGMRYCSMFSYNVGDMVKGIAALLVITFELGKILPHGL